MVSTPYRARARIPFSYTIFILGIIEAVLRLAPLLEIASANTAQTTFTFSLCDYYDRENVNLKGVMQHWRAAEEEETFENLSDSSWEHTEAESQYLQIYLKEVAEARGRNHVVNSSCLDPSIPYGRSKRQAMTFRDEQQKKDGTGLAGARSSKKGKEHWQSILSQVVQFVSYAICLAVICVVGSKPRFTGLRPLSLMSCLPLLFLGNGAHALTIDEVVQPTETTTADHSGFYLLQLVTPNKALVIILVVVTMIVYLLLCFWLSIGWLHFAKRLIFGATVPYRKEDGNDPEAVYLKEDPADYESDSASETETETRIVSSMKPGMMVDFKFKTSVLSDALVAYSSILNLTTLRDLMFGDPADPVDDEDGDDLE